MDLDDLVWSLALPGPGDLRKLYHLCALVSSPVEGE